MGRFWKVLVVVVEEEDAVAVDAEVVIPTKRMTIHNQLRLLLLLLHPPKEEAVAKKRKRPPWQRVAVVDEVGEKEIIHEVDVGEAIHLVAVVVVEGRPRHVARVVLVHALHPVDHGVIHGRELEAVFVWCFSIKM